MASCSVVRSALSWLWLVVVDASWVQCVGALLYGLNPSLYNVDKPSFLLSLNRWIIGDSPDEVFFVKLNKTDSASILKETIKEKNTNSFGNFDSKQLYLWEVCLPLDNLDTISSLKLENNTKISGNYPSFFLRQ